MLAALAKAAGSPDAAREQLRGSVAESLAVNIFRGQSPWPEDASVDGHVALLEAFAAHDKPRRPAGS